MDNPKKLATLGTQNTRRRQTKRKTQQNISWLQSFLEFRCEINNL